MPTRRRSGVRRSRLQVSADRASEALAERLGRTVKEARTMLGLTQAQVAERAGVAPSTVGEMERGNAADVSLLVWVRVALAVDRDLRAFLEGIPGADVPRDYVHLRNQERILAFAATGGWTGMPEAALDADGRRSRAADVLLRRTTEEAVVEVYDWFDDVGAAWRGSTRKQARASMASTGRGGSGEMGLCWVVRATQRNRRLIREHARMFAAWFPGSSRAWLAALSDASAPMPTARGLVWISVDGTRLSAVRLTTP